MAENGPRKPLTRCTEPHCPNPVVKGKCAEHQRPSWTQRSRWQPSSNTKRRKRTRQAVMQRDQGLCYVCGQSGATQMDHITPLHLGGSEYDMDNLGAIHSGCHEMKSRRESAQLNRGDTLAGQGSPNTDKAG